MEKRKMTAVRLEPAIHKTVALYAANHGKSISQVLAEVVGEWVVKLPNRAKYEKLQETP